MRKEATIWLIFSVFLLLAPTAYGDTLKVPRDYPTIQEAIDAASVGDTIGVSPGTYFGATVDKGVKIRARGRVIINDGPNSHSFLRAGFLFKGDFSGSGASIIGFRFEGEPQFARIDDGKLDFPIFSRGANNVTVKNNVMVNSLQAITNWDGSGWQIKKNRILDLWTLNGGGIGILVGGNDGDAHLGNVISRNKILGTLKVCSCDHGGYDGTGIVLYADFRWSDGADELTQNRIRKNKILLMSDTPTVVNANGIELTDSRDDPSPPVIFGNRVTDNDIKGVSGNGIVVSGTPNNLFKKNDIQDSDGFDAFDDTTGDGTAGTANIWDDNDCDTSSPAGICGEDDDDDNYDDDDDDDDEEGDD
jgi:hypothetical protein